MRMAEAPTIKPIVGEVTRNYPPDYEHFFPFSINLSKSDILPRSFLPNLKPPLQIHYEQNYLTPDENFPTSFITKLESQNKQNTNEPLSGNENEKKNEDYSSAPKFTHSFMESITPADLKTSHGWIEVLFPGYELVKAAARQDHRFGPTVRAKTDLTKVSSQFSLFKNALSSLCF